MLVSRVPLKLRPDEKPLIKKPEGIFSSPTNPRIAKLSHNPPKSFCSEILGVKSNISVSVVTPASSRFSADINSILCGCSLKGTSPRKACLTPETAIFSMLSDAEAAYTEGAKMVLIAIVRADIWYRFIKFILSLRYHTSLIG